MNAILDQIHVHLMQPAPTQMVHTPVPAMRTFLEMDSTVLGLVRATVY